MQYLHYAPYPIFALFVFFAVRSLWNLYRYRRIPYETAVKNTELARNTLDSGSSVIENQIQGRSKWIQSRQKYHKFGMLAIAVFLLFIISLFLPLLFV